MKCQHLASQSSQSLPSHFQTELPLVQTELFYLTAHSFLRWTVCAEFTHLSLLNTPFTLPPSLFTNLLVSPHSTWSLPSPGIKPTSPALEGEVLATELPGKSLHRHIFVHTVLFLWKALLSSVCEQDDTVRAGPLCRQYELWCGVGQVCLYIDQRNAVLLTCVPKFL